MVVAQSESTIEKVWADTKSRFKNKTEEGEESSRKIRDAYHMKLTKEIDR